MCGIAGLFAKTPAAQAPLGADLAGMLGQLVDRGPDSAGLAVYRDPVPVGTVKVSVLHRGGAAIDLPALAATLGDAPDGLPLVGPTAVDGLWLCCGWSGTGFKTGPSVGAALAGWIAGGPPPEDLAAFAPTASCSPSAPSARRTSPGRDRQRRAAARSTTSTSAVPMTAPGRPPRSSTSVSPTPSASVKRK